MKKFKKLRIADFEINAKKRVIRPLLADTDTVFTKVLEEELKDKDLKYRYQKGVTYLYADNNLIIRADKKKGMTYLCLPDTKKLPTDFLTKNNTVEYFLAPNVRHIGMYVLSCNNKIKHLHLPKVRFIDKAFMLDNHVLETILTPVVRYIGHYSFRETKAKQFIAPLLEYVGRDVFIRANLMQLISAPALWAAERGFVAVNNRMTRFYAPKFYPEYYGSHLTDEDKAFYLHPKRNVLLKNKANIQKICKKETFLERLLLNFQNRLVNFR